MALFLVLRFKLILLNISKYQQLFLINIYNMQAQVQAKPYFILSNGLFTTNKGKQIIKSKQTIQSKRVQLNFNRLPSILKEISHINFSGTQFMQLSYNDIISIQFIRHLNAPFLKDLHLSFNHITLIFSLAKSYFPDLQTLSLMANPIVDQDSLQIMNFPKLKKLLLDDPKQTAINFQNANVLAKCVPPFIETVRFHTNKIKQAQILAMLLKRKPASGTKT